MNNKEASHENYKEISTSKTSEDLKKNLDALSSASSSKNSKKQKRKLNPKNSESFHPSDQYSDKNESQKTKQPNYDNNIQFQNLQDGRDYGYYNNPQYGFQPNFSRGNRGNYNQQNWKQSNTNKNYNYNSNKYYSNKNNNGNYYYPKSQNWDNNHHNNNYPNENNQGEQGNWYSPNPFSASEYFKNQAPPYEGKALDELEEEKVLEDDKSQEYPANTHKKLEIEIDESQIPKISTKYILRSIGVYLYNICDVKLGDIKIDLSCHFCKSMPELELEKKSTWERILGKCTQCQPSARISFQISRVPKHENDHLIFNKGKATGSSRIERQDFRELTFEIQCKSCKVFYSILWRRPEKIGDINFEINENFTCNQWNCYRLLIFQMKDFQIEQIEAEEQNKVFNTSQVLNNNDQDEIFHFNPNEQSDANNLTSDSFYH